MSHLLLSILALGLLAGAAGAEQVTDPKDQVALSLTLYNQDLALIRDRRRVTLATGIQDLAIRGVSGRLQPQTALLERRDGPAGLKVLEQNFNYDLLTPEKLLEKYLGRQITIVRANPATGAETHETATVLSVQDGLVVRVGDRIETNPKGRFIFERIPEDLRDQPTLVTRLQVETPGTRELELSYLSGGLSWQADYVARLADDERTLGLAGWVTLSNESGTSYHDARLQLVAGRLHRVSTPPMAKTLRSLPLPTLADQPLAEERLLDYHLYTLPRPTTLLDRQTKQVALLAAPAVPTRKTYRVQSNALGYRSPLALGEHSLPVEVWLKFRNDAAAGLGKPLPAGVVRVYKADRQGNLQFVGEDRIDHTPKGEEIALRLGSAFDISARRVQTAFTKRDATGPYRHAAESAFRITLRNATPGKVRVEVRETLPGDWRILAESLPHQVLDAHQVQWEMEVPAEGQARLDYRVLTRY